MRPLLAILVIAVLVLVAWTVYGVLPAGTEGDARLEADREPVRESIEFHTSQGEGDPQESLPQRIQTDRVIEYHLVDAETGEGLPEAGIFKIKTGELILRCDEEGVAQSTEPDPGQLYFYAEDYLLGFFLADRKQLTQLRAQAGEGAVRVPLHRDVLSIPLDISYFDAGGKELVDVICDVTLLEGAGRVVLSDQKIKGMSPEIRRAWRFDKEAPGRSANLIRPPWSNPSRSDASIHPAFA